MTFTPLNDHPEPYIQKAPEPPIFGWCMKCGVKNRNCVCSKHGARTRYYSVKFTPRRRCVSRRAPMCSAPDDLAGFLIRQLVGISARVDARTAYEKNAVERDALYAIKELSKLDPDYIWEFTGR